MTGQYKGIMEGTGLTLADPDVVKEKRSVRGTFTLPLPTYGVYCILDKMVSIAYHADELIPCVFYCAWQINALN